MAEATIIQLAAGLDQVRQSPRDSGTVEMIVCRPAVDERVELEVAELDVARGVVADSWSTRKSPNPKAQVTVMNARAAQLVAGDRSRWALAGDQLYVDFDLSPANLPPGSLLAVVRHCSRSAISLTSDASSSRPASALPRGSWPTPRKARR